MIRTYKFFLQKPCNSKRLELTKFKRKTVLIEQLSLSFAITKVNILYPNWDIIVCWEVR